ncbi:MAG: hypothetical protein R3176_00555 [Woeseiaceae bacterium]|nr:hypothetical protein [Woeseiaceae bacterium]
MAFDSTITEHDLDNASRNFVMGLGAENEEYEPDLAVDGLSDSFVSRLLGLFGVGRTRR